MWLTMAVGYVKRFNLLKNAAWQLLIMSGICVLWDLGTGWRGWSVNIGIPDFMEKLKGAPYIACDLFKWEDTNVSMEEPTEYAKDTKAAKVVITSGGKINQVLLTIKD